MRRSTLHGIAAEMRGSPVRLGIVGCGMVVERGHLPALAGLQTIQLTAVADPLPDRRRAAGRVPGYASLEEMLAAEDLEAVLVCSPPALHLPHAEACAAAGIRTLIEKPPGLTLEETRRLSALHPPPVIGFNRRFARHLPVAGRRVASPSRVTAIFDAPPGDWDRGEAADPLLDLGCHLVDLGCWITGASPARARATTLSAGRVGFEIEMRSGLRLLAECGAAASYRELIEVHGEDGETRMWRWPGPAVRSTAERIARLPSPLVRSWRSQLQAFAGVIRGAGAGRLASARDAVYVMGALQAVQASAAGNRDWVTISPDPSA